MTIEQRVLRPSDFSRRLLRALDASEGRRKRRKRDTTPDSIGMSIKRDLLEQAVVDDPEPDAFEGWLLEQALAAPASGPVRALAGEIHAEFRLAAVDPDFDAWLAAGAPSADTDVTCDVHPPGECPAEHAERLQARTGRRRE